MAREAMVAALLGEAERLREVEAVAVHCERRAGDAPLDALGYMAAMVRLLGIWLEADPSARADALRYVEAAASQPHVVRQARHALADGREARMRQLLREDRYNRAILLLNSATDLGFSILTFNFQGMAHAMVDPFFLGVRLTESTPRTREFLALYDAWREDARERASREALPDYSARAERARKQRDVRLVRDDLAWGRWHLDMGRPAVARETFAAVLEIDPNNARAKAGALRAAERLSAEYRARARSLAMGPRAEADSDTERLDAHDLARRICLGDPGDVRQAAERFRHEHPLSSLSDDAAYCEIVAIERLQTQAGDDRAQVEPISTARWFLELPAARQWNASSRLRAAEDSPRMNAEAALRQADRARARDYWRYVLLGIAPESEGPQIFSFQDRLHRFIDPVGLLMPVQWIVHTVRLSRGKPVADDAWRAAALRYLEEARADSDEERRGVALRLSKSYERMRRYDEARRWRREAVGGEDAAYDARLDEKTARRVLSAARDEKNANRRRALLAHLVERYPSTRACEKARALLAKEKAVENSAGASDSLRITKAQLRSWPQIWQGQGLSLDSAWFDGERANGELRENGVRIERGKVLRVRYALARGKGDDEERAVDLDAASFEPLLDAWLREERARERSRALLDRPILPFELDAAAGPSGLDFYPRLLELPYDPEQLPLYE